jgi:hypothetical protein
MYVYIINISVSLLTTLLHSKTSWSEDVLVMLEIPSILSVIVEAVALICAVA